MSVHCQVESGHQVACLHACWAVIHSNDQVYKPLSLALKSTCTVQHHLVTSGLPLSHGGTTCWGGTVGAQALHCVDAEGVLACRVWASWSDSTTVADISATFC